MTILSIDTSGLTCGAAVVDSAAGLIASAVVNPDILKSAHSVELMAIIDTVLKEANLEIGDIDAFAVVEGPGSFTGLRVGIAAVNGLCYATGKPAVAVSSLEALAWNFPFAAHPVCPIIDARQGEVYAAVFQWQDGGFKAVIEPGLFLVNDLLSMKMFDDSRVIFTGSGVTARAIAEPIGSMAVFAEDTHISPIVVGRLALKKAADGDFASALRPVYLKMPLAVEKLQSGRG
ncbi:MAG: tRNA (adenosine(37)-N6)-threonylcarbamoyltransferase complex dimerization subunit type 1 TsaB [Candidatus Magnetominusculus sp. LBB02]|nr:tRNA (adenosine(37)-N6)-threonylcarbamoyltransferase complex dimerization subunit type 1 TsaB [Candidatus Magnetominusculus sp. LBB02]